MPVVALKRASYEEGVREAIEEFLSLFLGDVQGKRVLLKPNLLAPFPPEKAVTTHPVVVKAVFESLVSRGAKVKVGDNPGVGGYGMNESVARSCGIQDAVGKGYCNLAAEAVKVQFRSRFADTVVVSREVLEADLVISLPKFKTHSLTIITGGVKNMYGIAVGAEKAKLHTLAPTAVEFGEVVADLFGVRPPDLTLMDAIVGMEGNGPSAGKPRRLGLLLASDDAAAVDAAMVHAVGYDPRSIPHLRWVEQKGLGTIDLSKIDLKGELASFPRFKLPGTYTTSGFLGTLINRFAFRLFSKPKLKIDSKRCSACKICEHNCPAGSIKVAGDCAVVKMADCAACYLCHEICPESAVKITGVLGMATRRSAG